MSSRKIVTFTALALLASLAVVPVMADRPVKSPEEPPAFPPEKGIESLEGSRIDSVLAGPVITGTIANTDPTFNRPLDSSVVSTSCAASWSLSGAGSNVFYDVVPFRVSDSSPISIEVVTTGTTLSDSFLAVYCSFNPAAPLANGVVNDDDDGVGLLSAITLAENVTLNPANTYYLVITTFSNGQTGNYTINTSDNIYLPGSPANPQPDGASLTAESCSTANGGIDPGETVTASLCVRNAGGTATVALVGTLQATGGVENPSAAQSYGAIAPAATVCRSFTFNADLGLACGANLVATLALQDGATSYPAVAYNFTTGAIVSSTQTFSNPAAITIPSSGAATPYPSAIAVAGMTGTITDVNVTLTGFNHTFPDDTGFFLVGPTGAAFEFAGGPNGGTDAVGLNLTLDDQAASQLPVAAALASGTFRPMAEYLDLFPAPAPGTVPAASPAGTATFASQFNGTAPNGTWNLFVADFASGDSGSVSGGWSVTITSGARACCTGACTVTPPANIVVPNTPGQCSATATYGRPAVAGICGLVTCTPPSGSVFPVGVNPVTCDPEAPGANAVFNITVQDVQAPAISCPANLNLFATPTEGGRVGIYTTPTPTDNCPGPTASCAPPSGTFFPIGTTPIGCTATDASGNTATCGFNAIVTARSVTEIPTLDEIGLALLVLLLGAAALVLLRRQM